MTCTDSKMKAFVVNGGVWCVWHGKRHTEERFFSLKSCT